MKLELPVHTFLANWDTVLGPSSSCTGLITSFSTSVTFNSRRKKMNAPHSNILNEHTVWCYARFVHISRPLEHMLGTTTCKKHRSAHMKNSYCFLWTLIFSVLKVVFSFVFGLRHDLNSMSTSACVLAWVVIHLLQSHISQIRVEEYQLK